MQIKSLTTKESGSSIFGVKFLGSEEIEELR
jgi:hypothetical protein